jgi:hypothetical protein
MGFSQGEQLLLQRDRLCDELSSIDRSRIAAPIPQIAARLNH